MLLALSVLTTSFAVSVVSTTGETADGYKGFGYEHKVTSTTPLYMIDFENMSDEKSEDGKDSALSVRYRNGAALSYGEGYNGGTAVQTTGSTSYYLPLPEPITTGQYLLSFDYKQNINSSSYMYMRWNWDDGINTYFSVKDGKMGSVSNWSYSGQAYTPNEWVHVNLFLDFDRNTMDLYFDNKFHSQRTGMVDLTRDIIMTCDAGEGLVRSYDNFAMYPFTNDLRLELRQMGIEMPKEFYDDLDIHLSSKYSGNIFTEFSDVSMNVDLKNKSKEDVSYKLEYRVENYYDNYVDSGVIENCRIDGEGTATHEIFPKVDKYDIYNMYITVTPDFEGAEQVTIDREFSVAHTPTLGYKNPIFGTCTHPGRDRTDWREIERQFHISGIGSVRTDGNWGAFEQSPGNYSGNNGHHFEAENSAWAQTRSPNFFADRAAEGTNNLLIFNPTNSLYSEMAQGPSTYERIAASPEALAALEKATEELARQYKGRVNWFELGNELNFQRVEVMSPEAYTRICQAAYKGFKKGNPDCIVLSHGHSRAAEDLIYRYLMEAKRNGLGKPFDGVAIHSYVGQGYPEQTMYEDNIYQAQRAIERAGYTRDDYQIWMTESGATMHRSYFSEVQHANMLMRVFSLIQGFDLCDKFFNYQLQVAMTNIGDGEHWFGILQGRTTKNANAAKPTYLAICNWNALTENAEVVNTKRFDDRKTVFIQYKRPNGKYLWVMYTTSQCKDMTISTGGATGTIYDLNGNPTEISSADGRYTFTLTDTPFYFETEGAGFDIFEENDITKDKESIKLGKGAYDTFEVTLPEGATLELDGTDTMTLNQTQEGNVVTVNVEATELPKRTEPFRDGGAVPRAAMYFEHKMEDGTLIFRDYIYGYVKQNGVTTDMIMLPVNYSYNSADVTFLVKPYDNSNTKYWKGIIEVKNNKPTPISGTVTFTSPESLKNLAPIEIKDLQPGDTKKVVFGMPYEASSGSQKRKGVFTLSDGEQIEFYLGDLPESMHYTSPDVAMPLRTLEKIGDEGVVFDGNLTEEEWGKFKVCDIDKSQVSYGNQGYIIDGVVERNTFTQSDDYGGKEDFSGSIYAKWDEEYLYAASIVYDDVHWQKQDVRSFYYDDVFYIGGRQTRNQRHDSKVDIALSDYHAHEVFDESEKHGRMWCNYTQVAFGHNAQQLDKIEELGTECYVVRKDTVTIYEVKIPWSQIIGQDGVDRRQFYLYFAHRDYDGDRDKSNTYGGWFYLADTQD